MDGEREHYKDRKLAQTLWERLRRHMAMVRDHIRAYAKSAVGTGARWSGARRCWT